MYSMLLQNSLTFELQVRRSMNDVTSERATTRYVVVHVQMHHRVSTVSLHAVFCCGACRCLSMFPILATVNQMVPPLGSSGRRASASRAM